MDEGAATFIWIYFMYSKYNPKFYCVSLIYFVLLCLTASKISKFLFLFNCGSQLWFKLCNWSLEKDSCALNISRSKVAIKILNWVKLSDIPIEVSSLDSKLMNASNSWETYLEILLWWMRTIRSIIGSW